MPHVLCQQCGKTFYSKPSHLLKGWGKYCSKNCQNKAQRKGRQVQCFMCRKKTYKTLLQLKRSKSGKFFCSKRCQTIWRNTIVFTGENHANWAGGESVYRKILKKAGKLDVCLLCETHDKRVLMVHHIDKNRKNNTIENLVALCNNCHYLVHHYYNEQKRLYTLIDK